ncbi:MAG: hypothetical protein CM1200mP2_46000 [Planctomycetaceae bacterium]|nr:MAG: hypothetical protein CM1200mP2_46000 [Planctomycetaceae bacterium]
MPRTDWDSAPTHHHFDSWLPKGIRQLAEIGRPYNLAVSLHAPNTTSQPTGPGQ